MSDRYVFDSDQTVEIDGIPYQYKKGDSVPHVEAVRLGLAKAKEERAMGAAPENRAAAKPEEKKG